MQELHASLTTFYRPVFLFCKSNGSAFTDESSVWLDYQSLESHYISLLNVSQYDRTLVIVDIEQYLTKPLNFMNKCTFVLVQVNKLPTNLVMYAC